VSGVHAGTDTGNHSNSGSAGALGSSSSSSDHTPHNDSASSETVAWTGHEDIQILNPLENGAGHVHLHTLKLNEISGFVVDQVIHDSMARSVSESIPHELITLPSYHNDAAPVIHANEAAGGVVHSRDAFEVVGEIQGAGNGFVGASYVASTLNSSIGSPVHSSHHDERGGHVMDKSDAHENDSSQQDHAGTDSASPNGSEEPALTAPAGSGFFASIWSAVRGLTATAGRMADRGADATHRRR
jgi:hypothetical protein